MLRGFLKYKWSCNMAPHEITVNGYNITSVTLEKKLNQ